jgi:hypothetical protein
MPGTGANPGRTKEVPVQILAIDRGYIDYEWLDAPLDAPPALAGVHDDAQQLEITW